MIVAADLALENVLKVYVLTLTVYVLVLMIVWIIRDVLTVSVWRKVV